MVNTLENYRYYVYLILDPTNCYKPFYVGKGTGDRAKQHLRPNQRETNLRKEKKIAKIRKNGSEPVVLFWEENISESDAYDIEIALISRFGRMKLDDGGILTNILIGGTGGRSGLPVSENTREKIDAAQRGELNHRYGKTFTSEQKAKRSQIIKDLGIKPPIRSGPMPDEQKRKISEANRGRKWSDESRARASAERKGVKKTKPLSAETIEKIRQSNIGIKKRARTEKEKAAMSIKQEEQWNGLSDEQKMAHRERIRLSWECRRAKYGPSGRPPKPSSPR